MSAPSPTEETADFLEHCQVSTTGNPMLEQIKDRGSEAVLALFRLVKNALVHAIDNRAVTQTAAQSRDILSGFASMVGTSVSVTFLGDTIFVCGQLLRASRSIYESARELGEIFQRCSLSEITVEADVTAENLLAFADALAQSYREAERRQMLFDAKIPHVAVRKVEAELVRRERDAEAPLHTRILQFYATALVVMRGFFDSVAGGATILPHRVKRLSQKLVTLSETSDPALLGLTALANAHRDDAGRAVLAAILAVVLGRKLTSERVVLARLAMAALMTDVGRVRVAGLEGRDRLLSLPESAEALVPHATATVCIATGGVNVPNALRTVVTYEATWLEREKLLGSLYRGKRAALVEARVLRLVRALLDELAPRDAMVPSKSPLDALEAVTQTPGIDPVLLRLFIAAVGLMPAGTVVEFETGEWGVVVGPSRTPDAFDRPIVRLVTDRGGRPLSPAREVDLGAPAAGTRVYPRITNVVPPKQARFNVTRVFLG